MNFFFKMLLALSENSPLDCMNSAASLPPLMEGYGRKRKKRTSIETNIKLTLEKRFLDVSRHIRRAHRSPRIKCSSLSWIPPPPFLNFFLHEIKN